MKCSIIIVYLGVVLSMSTDALSNIDSQQQLPEKLNLLFSKLNKIDQNNSYLINNLLDFYSQLENSAKQYNNKSLEYLGCFQDHIQQRMFRGYAKDDYDHLTNKMCVEICKKFRFAYAGTQAGRTCHCGDSGPDPALNAKVADNRCKDPCVGDRNELCGGPMLMSIYRTGIKQYRFDQHGSLGESSTFSERKWELTE